ncbi:hypothetical protein CPC08DRAFT_711358 [Agrocybe pediades]|nr:hypothetical protein CPC08DRAFT_711358 [Agrocybe pediades]
MGTPRAARVSGACYALRYAYFVPGCYVGLVGVEAFRKLATKVRSICKKVLRAIRMAIAIAPQEHL